MVPTKFISTTIKEGSTTERSLVSHDHCPGDSSSVAITIDPFTSNPQFHLIRIDFIILIRKRQINATLLHLHLPYAPSHDSCASNWSKVVLNIHTQDNNMGIKLYSQKAIESDCLTSSYSSSTFTASELSHKKTCRTFTSSAQNQIHKP